MTTKRTACLAAAGLLALVGCGGQKLRLANFRAIELGETSRAELTELVGNPDRTDVETTEGRTSELLHYFHYGNTYATLVNADGAKWGIAEIVDGRVNAYGFSATLGRDQAPVDEASFAGLVEKRSTMADVTRAIGAPSLKVRTPSRIEHPQIPWPTGAKEVWGYESGGGVYGGGGKRRSWLLGFDSIGRLVSKGSAEAVR